MKLKPLVLTRTIRLENALRDIKSYLKAGPIETKDDRAFCILKINLVLDDEKPIKIR